MTLKQTLLIVQRSELCPHKIIQRKLKFNTFLFENNVAVKINERRLKENEYYCESGGVQALSREQLHYYALYEPEICV